MRVYLQLERFELRGVRGVRRRGDAPLLLAHLPRVAEDRVESRPGDEDPEEEAEREDELGAVEEELRMSDVVRGEPRERELVDERGERAGRQPVDEGAEEGCERAAS